MTLAAPRRLPARPPHEPAPGGHALPPASRAPSRDLVSGGQLRCRPRVSGGRASALALRVRSRDQVSGGKLRCRSRVSGGHALPPASRVRPRDLVSGRLLRCCELVPVTAPRLRIGDASAQGAVPRKLASPAVSSPRDECVSTTGVVSPARAALSARGFGAPCARVRRLPKPARSGACPALPVVSPTRPPTASARLEERPSSGRLCLPGSAACPNATWLPPTIPACPRPGATQAVAGW